MKIEQLHIREASEAREESLSPYAVKSKNSRGRLRDEPPCPIRTAFQRDRDRIIHSNSFRRLKHKTQVFIAPQGDHYVTRLTHTLEVSQIGRTIARALNLNEDLTEAICMGHDLGHTPFGHAGEEVLNELYPDGFRHNEQSLRVVDVLEKEGKGLNLTWEVRDGIVNHSKTKSISKYWGKGVSTLEGGIAKISDAIAYVNHDIDDAVRAGIISERNLPKSAANVLGHSRSERINTLVSDIIEQSWDVAQAPQPARAGKLPPPHHQPSIKMSKGALEATNTLRDFLFERVYNREAANEQTTRAKEILRLLYSYFTKHPAKLPPEYRRSEDKLERRVADYIAGMTDQFATRVAGEI